MYNTNTDFLETTLKNMETVLITFYIYAFLLGINALILIIAIHFEEMPDHYPAKKWWRKRIIAKE
jgi:hypothetical protein